MKIIFNSVESYWLGGFNYVEYLIRSLKQEYSSDVQCFYAAAANKKFSQREIPCGADKVVYYPYFEPRTLPWVLNRAKNFIFKNNDNVDFLRHSGADVFFGFVARFSAPLIPTLSWLPDFQHVHLPQMFSETERRKRDLAYGLSAATAARIVLMSEAVKKDYQIFSPKYSAKARVLKTAIFVPDNLYGTEPKKILEFYHLPEKFIFLPGQFWKHKNHRVVFEAMRILKEQGIKIFIVCTGRFDDYRHVNHYSELLRDISRWNLRDQIAFLGVISREHYFQLIRQSLCVLNPSLFEGFGLTLAEANTVGKSLLVSDIPAHTEQGVRSGYFFNPLSVEDCRQKLKWVWDEKSSGPDFSLEKQARERYPVQIKQCAESMMSVIKEVIQA